MKLLYAFPEPFPLPRARGVQLAHAVVELARQGCNVELAYVPTEVPSEEGGAQHPIRHYGLEPPRNLELTPISRALPWPLTRWHSNRMFEERLQKRLAKLRGTNGFPPGFVLMTRHLKLASLLAARENQPPLAYEAHEVFADTAAPRRQVQMAEMETRVMCEAALILANSKATAARLLERYGDRRDEHARGIVVLPNGVDFPEVIAEKEWANPGRHIVYSGSFFGWKGVTDLVQAAEHLRSCRVILLGGTPDQIERERARQPKQGAEIEYRGHVAHGEVARALQAACIAVLPNRDAPDSRFTSPIKLYEYMAAGCAVVASDLPALRDALPADAAVWVKPGDPASLASGICSLVDDPARAQAMGMKLRELARSHTWQARAAHLAELLRGIA